MKAPITEIQLCSFLNELKKEIILRIVQETIQKLEAETGIALKEINIDYSNLLYCQLEKFLQELGDYLPSWKKEILEQIEVWL